MRAGAVVVARMGSSRLPGKCLMDLGGRPVLARVVERVRQVAGLAGVVVATSDLPVDDPIEAWCRAEGVACFRGSESDVAGRVLAAGTAQGFDAIARINADSPLVLPELLGEALRVFGAGEADYVTNIVPRTYPYGLSVEVFSRAALERAYASMDEAGREHVTKRFYDRSGEFRVRNLDAPDGLARPGARLAVDTAEDLDRIRRLWAALPDPVHADYRAIVEAMDRLGPGADPRGRGSFVRQALSYTVVTSLIRPIKMINSIVLRRLIGPEAMGFWDGVVRVLLGANRVTGLGVGAAARLEIPFLRGQGEHERALAIRRTVFSLNAVTGGVYALGIAAAAFLLGERLGAQRQAILLCASALVVLQKFANLYVDILRADGDVRGLNWQMFLDAAVLLAGLLWLAPKWGVQGLCIATAASLAVQLAVMARRSAFPYRWDLRRVVLGPLILYGGPLLLLQSLSTALATVDRVMVTGFLGVEAMGIYGVGLLAYGALYDVANGVGIVLVTHLLEGYGRDRDLARLGEAASRPMRFLSLGMPVLFGLGALLFVPAVHLLMPRYEPGAGAARILLAAACCSAVSLPMRQVIATLRHQIRAVPILVGAVGLNASLNWVLLRSGWGIEGAAWATLASSVAGASAHLVYAQRLLGSPRRTARLLAAGFLPLGYAALGVAATRRVGAGEGWDVCLVRVAAFLAWCLPLVWLAWRGRPRRPSAVDRPPDGRHDGRVMRPGEGGA